MCACHDGQSDRGNVCRCDVSLVGSTFECPTLTSFTRLQVHGFYVSYSSSPRLLFSRREVLVDAYQDDGRGQRHLPQPLNALNTFAKRNFGKTSIGKGTDEEIPLPNVKTAILSKATETPCEALWRMPFRPFRAALVLLEIRNATVECSS